MVRVLLDTNVLVSALITGAKPRRLVKLAAEGKMHLVVSRQIIDEFAEVSTDPKIRRYVNRYKIASFVAFISSFSEFVQVKSGFRVVKDDPDDDWVVRAAYDAKVSYIVSGDRHLLKMKKVKGIRIVTADEMLGLLSYD